MYWLFSLDFYTLFDIFYLLSESSFILQKISKVRHESSKFTDEFDFFFYRRLILPDTCHSYDIFHGIYVGVFFCIPHLLKNTPYRLDPPFEAILFIASR
jgi:hypothetical protein